MKLFLLSNPNMKGLKWEKEFHRELVISSSQMSLVGEQHEVHLRIKNPSHEQIIDDVFFSPQTAIHLGNCLINQAGISIKKNCNQLELFNTNELEK